jgi:hypothetical protein
MKRTDSGLWIAPNFNILKFRRRERTVTLPNGERAKVWIDDSGTVKQTEHGDHLDALVRPAPINLRVELVSARPSSGGFARPHPIRAIAQAKGPR